MSETSEPGEVIGSPVEPVADASPKIVAPQRWQLADRWWGSLGLVLVGTFAFFMGQIIPSAVIGVWLVVARHHGQMPSEETLQVELIPWFSVFTLGSVLAVAAVIGLLVVVKQLPAGPAARSSWLKSVGWVAATFALVLAGAHGLSWFQTWLGYPVEEQEILSKAFKDSTGGPYASLVLAVVVLAPLGEELFFRRFVLMTLRCGFGVVVANLFTAWLFAIVHMNPPAFLIYCWLGLATAFAYQRTGRLWVPIAVHAANNLTAVLANAS